MAGDTAGSLEYLKHGEALAVAKVADKAVVACTQIVDGLHVGTRNRRKSAALSETTQETHGAGLVWQPKAWRATRQVPTARACNRDFLPGLFYSRAFLTQMYLWHTLPHANIHFRSFSPNTHIFPGKAPGVEGKSQVIH